mgnify:FL=1
MTEKTKGLMALIGIAFVWSLMAMLPRYLSISLPLFQQVYLRFLCASVFIALVFRKQINVQQIFSGSGKDYWPIFLRTLFYYYLGVTLYTQAVIVTKISNASFIGALPLMAVLGFILFKEKVTANKIFLVVLSFIGALLISVKDFSQFFVFGWGELIAFASAFFCSLGMLSRKWETKKFNNATSSFLVMTTATILVFLTSIFIGEKINFSALSGGTIMALLFAGLLNAVLVNLMSYGMKRVQGVLASNLLQLEVPLTVLLAIFFYQEIPMIKDLFGGGVIFVRAYLMNRLEGKRN